MLVFDTKALAKITGQTETAVHALARHLPLESESIGAGIKRHFSRVDAVCIVACRLLRRRGLPPAVAADIGVGLHPEFVKLDADPSYRSFLFASPTPARIWIHATTTDPDEAIEIINNCPQAVFVNVAKLMAEAEEEIDRHG